MSRIVTLRLSDDTHRLFRRLAENDNRPLSNFIETAAKRYLEEVLHVDEYEMAEIRKNKPLGESLRRGLRDAKAKKGRFAG